MAPPGELKLVTVQWWPSLGKSWTTSHGPRHSSPARLGRAGEMFAKPTGTRPGSSLTRSSLIPGSPVWRRAGIPLSRHNQYFCWAGVLRRGLCPLRVLCSLLPEECLAEVHSTPKHDDLAKLREAVVYSLYQSRYSKLRSRSGEDQVSNAKMQN